MYVQVKQFKDEYPIYSAELLKNGDVLSDIDSVITYIHEKINSHPVATYIGVFDHYKHTASLKEGKIAPEVLNAQNIMFCFGKEIVNPEVLAVRPRSLGVVEYKEHFVISFMKAPNPTANDAIISWVTALT